uniref:F-box domain-containing protein n=1 Tax=Caenorhabditis tropicalis TaxID=1561998 RepID=A0A1I7UTH8_9PELO
MAVPFLKLPSLVQNMIVKDLTALEKFLISSMSERARKAISTCSKHQKVRIQVQNNERIEVVNAEFRRTEFVIEMSEPPEGFNVGREYRRMPNAQFPIMIFAKGSDHYDPDRKPGLFHKIWDMVMKTFRQAEINVQLYFDPQYDLDGTIGALASYHLNLLKLKTIALEKATWQMALNSIRKVDKKISCEILRISGGRSIRMNDIIKLFLECRHVVMKTGRYSNQKFIKLRNAWIENDKCEYVETSSFTSVNSLDVIINGIPATPVQNVRITGWKRNQSITVRNGYLIQKKDGTPAIICTETGSFVMATKFRMFDP